MLADLMLKVDAVPISQRARSGRGQLFSEFVATFGLVTIGGHDPTCPDFGRAPEGDD